MKTKSSIVVRVITYLFVLLMAVIWISPVVWTLLTSLKSNAEIAVIGYKFLPIDWTLKNYTAIFSDTQNAPILRWFVNSFVISGSNTILILAITSMSAYAFTRLKFKGRDTIFWILMSTVMFPTIVNLIPLYKICDMLNWVDSPLSLIITSYPIAGGVFYIFLIRQFMIGIPKEFDEAAFIDGAGEWGIFTRIMIPLMRPVLTVVALFAFTTTWNDFLFPSVVVNSVDKLPLTPGLRLLAGVYEQKLGHTLASAIAAMIPTFILYLFTQKYFMKGLVLTSGIKA